MNAPAASSQFRMAKVSEAYWRLTFDNPPRNLITPETIREFQTLIGAVEAAPALCVVVFDSAHPDYFFSRYDLSRAAETPVANGPSGWPMWIDMTTRLSEAPVVSVALIRGRTRGGGSELALACDMRFASVEKAVFGQPEVGAGVLPGGGAIERLSLLLGRARAFEVILGSDDLDALTAERYGWINRALPDADLDGFVDALARRVASFDKAALAEAKRLLNRRTLPQPADLLESQTAFLRLASSVSARERGARLARMIGTLGADQFELDIGRHLGP
jgi:enoyl-CoA hydratase/carnithine racemase